MAVFQKLVCGKKVGEDRHRHTRKCRGGEWYIDYYFEGQRIRECAGENKRQAQEALATRKTEILQGRFNWQGKLAPVNFKDFAEQEYLPYSKDKKGPNTYRRDQILIRHLCGYFGRQNLSGVTPEMVEKYMRWRRDGNGGKIKPTVATVNREVACLKNMFNMAMKWKKAFKNPVREVKLYKEPKSSMRILSRDEEKLLLANCAEHLKPIVLTALNTGMRKEEILSLTWDKINFDKRLITVDKTKNAEYRIIPMSLELTEILNRVKRVGSYVFCQPGGERYGNIRNAFESAVKRAGIPHIRFHDLRHTFATRYMEHGDVVTLKDILGHKTIEMTMRYAHATMDKKRWCMDMLNVTLDRHYMDTKPKMGHEPISVSR